MRFFGLYVPPFSADGFDPSPGPNPPPSICEADTQEAADLCSTQPPFPNRLLPDVFFSSASTCTVDCADGTTSTFTAPANLFYGPSLATVQAQAQQFACDAANSFCSTPRPRNTEQTCNFTCPDDSTSSYTVPAGSFTGATQADADNAAYSFACSIAQLLCDGSPPPALFNSAAQSCSFTCPDGTSITITVPAGAALGLSQFSADSSAHELACALAQIACNNVPPLFGNTTQSCSQNCPGGGAVTYTVPAGAFVALDVGTANLLAFAYACQVAAAACITQEPPPDTTVGSQQQQCTIPCDGGSFVYILPAGSVRANNLATANAQAASLACLIGQSAKVCLGAIQPGVCSGTAYASFIVASGDTGPIVKISGALPPGITLSDGFLSGTSSQEGAYTFTVQAFSGNGYVTRTYTITVKSIVTSALVSGTLNEAYTDTIIQSGFTNPTFSIQGGVLPAGLTLSSNGVVSGIPTESGTFVVIVQVDGD